MPFSSLIGFIVALDCCSILLLCGLTWAVRRRKHLFSFLAASWITLFGILIVGAYSVNHTANVAKNGLQYSLSGLAKSFAVALKDAGHNNVPLETPEDDLYWKLINMMSAWQQKIPTVASIYTLRQNEKGELIFICCPPADLDRNGKIEGKREQLVPKGTVYEYDSEEDIREVFDAWRGKSGFSDVPSPDDWGLWITATEPILDDTGEQVHAVLGVDFWGEDWNANIQRAVWWPELFLLAVIVFFFAVQVVVFRRQIIEDQLTAYTANLERVTDELVAAKKDADIAAQAKSFFLANVSHEIRTPLNAILGCADMLISIDTGLLEGVSREELVEIMQKNSKNLMTLIDDVLTFSSIETRRIVLESVPVRLRQLIEHIKTMTSGIFAEKPNVEFHVECGESVPEVILSDPVQIRQILICLVNNAVKFTQSGHITVRCSVTRLADKMVTQTNMSLAEPSRYVPLDFSIAQSKGLRGTVPITESAGQQTSAMYPSFPSGVHELSPDSWVLRLDVSDTGVGIDQEQVDSLFKPFSQGDNSLTRRFGGIGLGLSIVKGLVQLMGGKVQVDSKPGHGSTFSVWIPVNKYVNSP